MRTIYANNGAHDLVVNAYKKMVNRSKTLWIAAPYVTMTGDLLEAAKDGKTVLLLVGLNDCTDPKSLALIHAESSVSIRYYTRGFHSKLYIFDEEALLGSANLTSAGMERNREAVIHLEEQLELERVREIFQDLWKWASILDKARLKSFSDSRQGLPPRSPNESTVVEKAMSVAAPPSSFGQASTQTQEDLFVEDLRRRVAVYKPAFSEVSKLLEMNDFRRAALIGIGIANETNRFLNWVRLMYIIGDSAWKDAKPADSVTRASTITKLGAEWKKTDVDKVPPDYIGWLQRVQSTFGSRDEIDQASQEAITAGLMSLHAFSEQQRWNSDFRAKFWSENQNDIDKVRRTLKYLIFSDGDMVLRLHRILSDERYKLVNFGKFSALELFGTIRPEEYPPMNGRMAKALKYLGFSVLGN